MLHLWRNVMAFMNKKFTLKRSAFNHQSISLNSYLSRSIALLTLHPCSPPSIVSLSLCTCVPLPVCLCPSPCVPVSLFPPYYPPSISNLLTLLYFILVEKLRQIFRKLFKVIKTIPSLSMAENKPKW